MASSSSSFSSSRKWTYQVFPSFSGEDVRKTFLSHFLRELERKGIHTFNDHGIKRGHEMGLEIMKAINESRILIVILSLNYASSSWCLNELLEIMKPRNATPQKVMTVFYGVDPSHVRKQVGDFGKIFEEACSDKTEEEKQRWKKVLTVAAGIAGEDSRKWANEAAMVEKIARDVSNELNSTPSRDFDNLVGMDAHIARLCSLLYMRSDEVRMIGIWGPAGIGKTTVARALYNEISVKFQRCCFMEHVKVTYKRADFSAYGAKLDLQERFLSEILNHEGMRINHLGVARERLEGQRVLAVLDDVDDIEQLRALAAETRWFGPGSRIIVTTKDRQLLRAHGINHVYEVNLPLRDEALQIFCQYAFKRNSPPHGFEGLTKEVVNLSGHLPLGLKVLGSSLKGLSKYEWMIEVPRLRNSLNGQIEETLRVGYEGLDDRNKSLFIRIACLFNGEDVYSLMELLANGNLNVESGLKELENRSLIHISLTKQVVMHDLLQQMGREIVRRQCLDNPGKRQYLVDAKEICDVFIDGTATDAVLGISLNMSEIDALDIEENAFDRMWNLQFLRLYMNPIDGKVGLKLRNGLNYLPRKLSLLHWDACSMKCMPFKFRPEFLVELTMQHSELEKLWDGIQPLRNLRKIDLSDSKNLKEVPDLSEAKNIEILVLNYCESLVMLPSSVGNLRKLTLLDMRYCRKLEALPTDIRMESLDILNMEGCSQLKRFPEISDNIVLLNLCDTSIEEVPPSLRCWSRLHSLLMSRCRNLKKFPLVPRTVQLLDLSRTRIEGVPSWIENLTSLHMLFMRHCKKLRYIPSNISKLERLAILDFSYCYNLAPLPAETMQLITCSIRAKFPFGEILYRIHPLGIEKSFKKQPWG